MGRRVDVQQRLKRGEAGEEEKIVDALRANAPASPREAATSAFLVPNAFFASLFRSPHPCHAFFLSLDSYVLVLL